MLPGIGFRPSPTHSFPSFESQGEATVFATGTDDEDRLSAAQSNLPSIGGKIKVIGTASIDSTDLTIDADTELDLTSGRVDVASGRTLTVNGSVTPTDRQIFSGDGTVTFGTENRRVNAHWFPSASMAVAACPEGGEIKITRNLDVASYGRFLIEDKIVHFRGIAWGQDAGGTEVGPRLINTGGDVVDSPVIEYNAASAENGANIDGLLIEHEGSSSFAILVDNHKYSYIHDSRIFLNDTGHGGISYANDAFFARLERTNIQRFASRGVSYTGNGGAHVIRDCHIATGQDNTDCVYTELAVHIYGGQINSSGSSGVGIKAFANGSALENLRVEGTLFENGVGIELTGSGASVVGAVLENLKFTLGGSVTTGVKFDRARSCLLLYPNAPSPAGADLAEWTANSQDCGIRASSDMMSTTFTVASGATDPYVEFEGPTAKGNVDNIDVQSGLFVSVKGGFRTGSGYMSGDIHHNGVAWDFVTLSSVGDDAATSFTPPYDRGIVEIGGFNNTANACIVAYEARTGNSETALLGGGSNVTVTTGALTGTDGMDGDWTVSAHTDGSIYIENRTGGSEFFTARIRAGFGE